ncbi:hypothetical protein HY485_01995 [Candidatus Woesearchaeota archaeon]|nr:hypothetical protein [Candidatus Woesearchaeota archaeon]
MAFWKKLLHKETEESLVPQVPEPEISPRNFSPLSAQGLEPQFGPPPMAPPEPVHHAVDSVPDAELRVISAKLDTVKALLEVINQRLDRLEGKKSEELVKWR